MKPVLLGQNLAAKKAVKMEAYVSPTMGNVKERKARFKEKVSMDSTANSPKGKSLSRVQLEKEKTQSMHQILFTKS
ncbi:hypothetical protein SLEP1_g6602 [Rubroshorea leprosula]|uniref:Uncharacterized protein n=1 Tax=Rubroshorea leprosula TaxID=152421 RepID=A0AAV5I6J5_9ROSI|nr:hypothetical protein SLEP1_g6602 [Rubroshorea leprosula]